jgi:hypothetical protein
MRAKVVQIRIKYIVVRMIIHSKFCIVVIEVITRSTKVGRLKYLGNGKGILYY